MTVGEERECLTLRFEGRMDTVECMDIEAELRAKVDRPGMPVVFDLAQVDFVSSAFLRLCIHAHRQAGEFGFRIVNVDPFVKRVFKIAGLDFMLHGGSLEE